MPPLGSQAGVPECRRKEAFHLLVLGQDLDMSVPESRRMIADRFGFTDSQILQIEREGVEGNWPPLAYE